MKGILFKQDIWVAKKRVLEEQGFAVTRRASGLKEINQEPDMWYYSWHIPPSTFRFEYKDYPLSFRDIKPRYKVGEVVYVKETWATDAMFDNMSFKEIGETKVATIPIWYRHDDMQEDNPNTTQGRWRSPRFMPAWAARLFCQILSIDIEKLALPLSHEEIELEGGNVAADFLKPYEGLWHWRYSFKLVLKP